MQLKPKYIKAPWSEPHKLREYLYFNLTFFNEAFHGLDLKYFLTQKSEDFHNDHQQQEY